VGRKFKNPVTTVCLWDRSFSAAIPPLSAPPRPVNPCFVSGRYRGRFGVIAHFSPPVNFVKTPHLPFCLAPKGLLFFFSHHQVSSGPCPFFCLHPLPKRPILVSELSNHAFYALNTQLIMKQPKGTGGSVVFVRTGGLSFCVILYFCDFSVRGGRFPLPCVAGQGLGLGPVSFGISFSVSLAALHSVAFCFTCPV